MMASLGESRNENGQESAGNFVQSFAPRWGPFHNYSLTYSRIEFRLEVKLPCSHLIEPPQE